MKDPMEQRLEQMFGRRAEVAGEGDSLARTARIRGQRLIRRRRISAGAACLAALVIVVPFGLTGPDKDGDGVTGNNRDPQKTELGPTDTPRPEPTPSVVRPEQLTIALDLDALTEGEPPQIPWYFDGVIHDGDERYPIGPLPAGRDVSFSATAYGYLARIVETTTQTPSRAYLVTSAGERTDLPDDVAPIVSTDGRTLAWAEGRSGNTAKRLVTADAETGEVKRTSAVVARTFAVDMLGFVGDQVAFSASEAGRNAFTARWSPTTNEVDEVDGVTYGTSASSDGLLVAELPVKSKAEDPCPVVVDVTAGDRELWHDCGILAARLAVDDSYVVAAYEGKLFDPSTGELLVRIRHDLVNDTLDTTDFQLEPDGDLLFVATTGNPGRQALVRCSAKGECELAGQPIHEMPANTYDPAYALSD